MIEDWTARLCDLYWRPASKLVEVSMKNRSLVPTPWSQVGLAVLPGLLFLLIQASALQIISETLVHLLGSASLLFLIVSSV